MLFVFLVESWTSADLLIETIPNLFYKKQIIWSKIIYCSRILHKDIQR